jgi:cardiolipin synthase A/B
MGYFMQKRRLLLRSKVKRMLQKKKLSLPLSSTAISPEPWKNVHCYFSATEYYKALLEAIDKAEESVEFESYIFTTDDLAEQFIAAFKRAAEKKVTVKIIVDGFGSSSFKNAYDKTLTQSGVYYRIYHEVPLLRFFYKRAQSTKLDTTSIFQKYRRFFTLLKNINSRNHRKLCIIDRKILFIGSRNITTDHLPLEQGGKGWQDVSVRAEGQCLEAFRFAFYLVWKPIMSRVHYQELYRQIKKGAFLDYLRLNSTYRLRDKNFKNLKESFKKASQRIWITNAYFIPHPSLLAALQKAAEKKIDVRIIVPLRSDVFFLPWVTSLFFKTLTLSGARVYEYTRGFVHTKSIIIDDQVIVGSSNLNHRSIFHDLEADIVLRDKESLESFITNYHQTLECCEEVIPGKSGSITFFGKVLGYIMLLFKRYF